MKSLIEIMPVFYIFKCRKHVLPSLHFRIPGIFRARTAPTVPAACGPRSTHLPLTPILGRQGQLLLSLERGHCRHVLCHVFCLPCWDFGKPKTCRDGEDRSADRWKWVSCRGRACVVAGPAVCVDWQGGGICRYRAGLESVYSAAPGSRRTHAGLVPFLLWHWVLRGLRPAGAGVPQGHRVDEQPRGLLFEPLLFLLAAV